MERVNDALEHGARLLAGGAGHELGGLFFTPTVLADVTPGMRIYREENFAPISGVTAFDALDEVVELANDTEYGLVAYICSTRVDVIWPLRSEEHTSELKSQMRTSHEVLCLQKKNQRD